MTTNKKLLDEILAEKTKHSEAWNVVVESRRKLECEICGSTIIDDLQVHHKDGNKENNNLSNLQFLCQRCHRRHHNLQKRPRRVTRTKGLSKIITTITITPELLAKLNEDSICKINRSFCIENILREHYGMRRLEK